MPNPGKASSEELGKLPGIKVHLTQPELRAHSLRMPPLLHPACPVSSCKPKLQMEIEIHNRFRANIQHTKVTSQWMQFATSMERQGKESKWSFEESVIYKLMQDQHFVSSAQRHPRLDIKYVKDLSLGNFLGSYQCCLSANTFLSLSKRLISKYCQAVAFTGEMITDWIKKEKENTIPYLRKTYANNGHKTGPLSM